MLYSINDTLNKHKPKDMSDTKLKLCENILGVCMDSKEDIIKRINDEINITIPYLTTSMAIIFKHLYYPSGTPRKKYHIKDYDKTKMIVSLGILLGVITFTVICASSNLCSKYCLFNIYRLSNKFNGIWTWGL